MINKIFKNRNRNNGENGPKVTYMNGLLKQEINSWVNYMNIGTFNKVLRNIGFKSDDIIYFYGVGLSEIHYSVNNEKLDKNNIISLSYGEFLESKPRIVITNGNMKKTYERTYLFGDDTCIMLESYEYLLDNKMKCKNCKKNYGSNNRILYIISDSRYEILLNIEYNDNDEYRRSLNSELELEKYFGSLVFPVDIDSMYKNICEIISLDVDKCGFFELRVNEIDLDNHKCVRDIINLVNGHLVKFGMTKNGKRIFMNDDGSYSYELVSDNEEDLKLDFSLDINNDNISYSVSNNVKNVIDDEMKLLVNETLDNALDDIEDSKKKVRKMFSGRWNG